MSVLGELVQSPKGSSYGKQAFCQSCAAYLCLADRNHSCFLAMTVAVVSVAGFVVPRVH